MFKCCCPCFTKTHEPDTEVQELDYHHASLNEVPPEIFTYERTLEKLDLGSNQIADLPPSLFHCHELRELNLCDNEVREIPPAVESLTRLAKLEIGRNALTEIPENIKNCKNLTYLDLSINTLTRLPDAICLLVNLEELFLNETNLEFLPANFGRLTKLRTLELRENQLQTLPKSMNRLHQLQKLDIGANDMDELPEVVGTMTNLIELWADTNNIRQIPRFIGNLIKLVCLDMSKNEIGEISSEIGKCTNLEDITLSCNSIPSLPDTLSKLENVATLRADNNCIEELPEDIGKLKNLQELSLGCNMLTNIPASVGLLRKLHTLYLDENQLSELPKEIGSCTSLSVLSVARNTLCEIPSEIGHLSSLKMLNLTSNAIRNLPVSILGLTNLGAIWLTDKQNKPLVAFNSEIDTSTGQHVVTCCLLPQLPATGTDQVNNDNNGDEPRRSKRRIRFQNEVEVPPTEKPIVNGGLLRAPTPYPKELRAMAKHVSQLRQTKGQNGGIHNQNEPLYEGEICDDMKDINVTDGMRNPSVNHTKRSRPRPDFISDVSYSQPEYREPPIPPEMTVEYEKKTDGVELNQKQWSAPLLMNEKMNSVNDGDILLHPVIGSTALNNEFGEPAPVAPSMDSSPTPFSSSHVSRTPPPYHIAAKRAAFFRSSGGAGSGKMNFPTGEQQQLQSQNQVPVVDHTLGLPPIHSPMSSSSYSTTSAHDSQPPIIHQDNTNHNYEVVQPSKEVPIMPIQTPAVDYFPEPSLGDNSSYNLNNVQHSRQLNENILTNATGYNHPLPDKNANIKRLYTPTDNLNLNANVEENTNAAHHHSVLDPESIPSDFPARRKPSLRESRIPSRLMGPSARSPAPPVAAAATSSVSTSSSNSNAALGYDGRELTSPPPASPTVSSGKIPSRKGTSTTSFQYEPGKSIPKASKTQSQSYIGTGGSTDGIKTGIKPPSSSYSSSYLKYSANSNTTTSTSVSSKSSDVHGSNIASSSSVNNNTNTGDSGSYFEHGPSRGSGRSRIPKFGASKTDGGEGSSGNLGSSPLPPAPAPAPMFVESPDRYMAPQPASPVSSEHSTAQGTTSSTKIPRSGIPKLSSSRDVTDSKLSAARKPWIFGTHKNARVESVEYKKITPDRLGFTIDEFAGPSSPEGKGIYVTATESSDLPIKVGDKILQVDGIDVDVNNMGVAIVSKILANCQENIQFLVSRQQ